MFINYRIIWSVERRNFKVVPQNVRFDVMCKKFISSRVFFCFIFSFHTLHSTPSHYSSARNIIVEYHSIMPMK